MRTDVDPLFCVADQVVLITGGTRGIGKAIAAEFVDRGSRVVICSRDPDTVAASASELSADGGDCAGLTCDVAEPAAVTQCVEGVLETHGRIDCLINVAGVNRRKRAEQVTDDDYEYIMNINLRGAFQAARAVGQHMIARGGGGTIINVESLNTYMPLKGVLPYAMSKFGMQGMTKALALEWGRHLIRVNGLAPGFILTDLTEKLWSDPTMQSWNRDNAPLERLGRPEDMAGACIFLASRASEFMTGQTVFVDGGFSAGWSWPIPLDEGPQPAE